MAFLNRIGPGVGSFQGALAVSFNQKRASFSPYPDHYIPWNESPPPWAQCHCPSSDENVVAATKGDGLVAFLDRMVEKGCRGDRYSGDVKFIGNIVQQKPDLLREAMLDPQRIQRLIVAARRFPSIGFVLAFAFPLCPEKFEADQRVALFPILIRLLQDESLAKLLRAFSKHPGILSSIRSETSVQRTMRLERAALLSCLCWELTVALSGDRYVEDALARILEQDQWKYLFDPDLKAIASYLIGTSYPAPEIIQLLKTIAWEGPSPLKEMALDRLIEINRRCPGYEALVDSCLNGPEEVREKILSHFVGAVEESSKAASPILTEVCLQSQKVEDVSRALKALRKTKTDKWLWAVAEKRADILEIEDLRRLEKVAQARSTKDGWGKYKTIQALALIAVSGQPPVAKKAFQILTASCLSPKLGKDIGHWLEGLIEVLLHGKDFLEPDANTADRLQEFLARHSSTSVHDKKAPLSVLTATKLLEAIEYSRSTASWVQTTARQALYRALDLDDQNQEAAVSVLVDRVSRVPFQEGSEIMSVMEESFQRRPTKNLAKPLASLAGKAIGTDRLTPQEKKAAVEQSKGILSLLMKATLGQDNYDAAEALWDCLDHLPRTPLVDQIRSEMRESLAQEILKMGNPSSAAVYLLVQMTRAKAEYYFHAPQDNLFSETILEALAHACSEETKRRHVDSFLEAMARGKHPQQETLWQKILVHRTR